MKIAIFTDENGVESVYVKLDGGEKVNLESVEINVYESYTGDLDIEKINIDALGDVTEHREWVNVLGGVSVKIGDTVEVPEPTFADDWEFNFIGTVVEVSGEDVVVEDQDGDCFTVEVYRLSVLD